VADVSIKTVKNGPYEVSGAIQLVDAKRGEFKLSEDPIYLCRCGQSKTRPFCDGSHTASGFKADETA